MSRRLLLIAAFVLSASAVQAEDFVFSVPVKIQNAAPMTGGNVRCILMVANDLHRGEAEAPFTVTNGAFDGVVKVPVNVQAGTPKADVIGYTCMIGKLTFPKGASTFGNWGDATNYAISHLDNKKLNGTAIVKGTIKP